MKKLQLILRKFAWSLVTILFVIVFNFFLFRVLPGDPSRSELKDPRITAENYAAIRARLGLDKPVINCVESLHPLTTGSCLINPFDTQFFIYIKNLLRGDLGDSFYAQQPVTQILGVRLVNTVILVFPAQMIAITIGIMMGIIAAWKSHTVVDVSTLMVMLVTWSVPTFWFGMIMLIWGSNWGMPLGGMVTAGMDYANGWEKILDVGKHIFIPSLTFAIIVVGQYTIIMRSTLMDILSEDYILTAKAKGLNTFQILKDHAVKNGMLPMITIIALNLSMTVAGAIQTETVFSYPGVGQAVFEAVSKRDYPLLQGAFLVIAITVVTANFLAELLYSYLDPRVEVS